MSLLAAFALTFAASGTASAHTTGPCDDSDGDGNASGREYAEHHIVSLAKAGKLGNDGHKPGAHKGFSACK
jgi:hypothetical protein